MTFIVLALAVAGCTGADLRPQGLAANRGDCPPDTVLLCSDGLRPCGCAILVTAR